MGKSGKTIKEREEKEAERKTEQKAEARETERARLLEAFFREKQYRPMRFKMIAAVFGVPKEERDELRALIGRMVEKGDLTMDGRGRYHYHECTILDGVFCGTKRGFGFVDVGDGTDVFVSERDTMGALHGDTVRVQVTQQEAPGRRREGKVTAVLKRETSFVVGTYEKSKGCGFVVPDQQKLGRDIFIDGKNSGGAVRGNKVYVKLLRYGSAGKNPEGRVVEILGHIDDPSADARTVCRAYQLETEFPPEVMAQAGGLPEHVSESERRGRLDLRQEPTVTIDGEDAKDLDDAITIERKGDGYLLGVHIADVTHYVREGSPLDQEALARGTSVYLIDKVVPMLPHRLSNGICSLNEGEDRLALSCLMEIDAEGNIVGHRVAETVLNVTRRMSYTQVQHILEVMETGEQKTEALQVSAGALEQSRGREAVGERARIEQEYGPLVPKFLLMKELSDLLREKRKRRGALDFDFAESRITLAEDGRPIDIRPYERLDSHKLIEDFMLAANETIAEDYFWQEIPFLYRVHETPDEEKIRQLGVRADNFGVHLKIGKDGVHPRELQRLLARLEGRPEAALVARWCLRSMKQARYEPDCEGHFGLAAKYYCHFTSPIRRYPDLQIHRIIKENLHGTLTGERREHYRAILDGVARQTSSRERVAEEAERELEKLKKVEFMERHIGEVYDGVISGVTGWGMYVELPNTVEGMIALSALEDYYVYDEEREMLIGERFHKTYRLGQRIRIVVAGADKLAKTIDFLPYNG